MLAVGRLFICQKSQSSREPGTQLSSGGSFHLCSAFVLGAEDQGLESLGQGSLQLHPQPGFSLWKGWVHSVAIFLVHMPGAQFSLKATVACFLTASILSASTTSDMKSADTRSHRNPHGIYIGHLLTWSPYGKLWESKYPSCSVTCYLHFLVCFVALVWLILVFERQGGLL